MIQQAGSCKRVLFVSPSAYPLGGVAVWLDYLVPGLEAHGWRATVGLVDGDQHDADAYRAAYPGIATVSISNRTGSPEGRIRAIGRMLDEYEPAIVVSVNIVDVFSAAARARANGSPVKVAMALHGIAADLLEDVRSEADLLDAVVATNRLTCRLCVHPAGMEAERVLYAPYGVSLPRARQPKARRDGPLRLAWVGRLEDLQKRTNDIALVLARLDELDVAFHLRIVGDGPDRQRLLTDLQKWIARGSVEWAGALPAASMAQEVYEASDVLLVTSEWETGPIVVWEAMAAGMPVVSSAYIGSGLEGALRDGANCLLFPIGDGRQAASQLKRLDGDSGLFGKLSEAGRQLVAARYSVDQSTAAWADCLDKIMQLPQRSPARRPLAPHLIAGRLDRLLGVRFAEDARSALGIRYRHPNPGSEWPHTLSVHADEAALQRLARHADVQG